MNAIKVIFIVVTCLILTNQTYAVEFGDNSWNIDNYYISLKVIPIGSSLIFSGYGTKSLIYSYTTILKIDVVDGVKCLRVTSIRTEKGELSEVWVAQDVSGNVYLLKHWDGDEPNPVILGKSKALIFVPSSPQIGDKVFGDKTVLEVGVTVPKLRSGLGPFTNCLKTAEPDGDIAYYAHGIGDIKKDYYQEDGGFELKELILGAGSSSDIACSTIDDTLKITVPCLMYNNAKLDINVVLENYINTNDPSGLYWKLNLNQ